MIKLDRRRRRKPKNDEEEEEERTEVGFQQDLIANKLEASDDRPAGLQIRRKSSASEDDSGTRKGPAMPPPEVLAALAQKEVVVPEEEEGVTESEIIKQDKSIDENAHELEKNLQKSVKENDKILDKKSDLQAKEVEEVASKEKKDRQDNSFKTPDFKTPVSNFKAPSQTMNEVTCDQKIKLPSEIYKNPVQTSTEKPVKEVPKFAYREPDWSGVCENEEYNLEVLKGGKIIGKYDMSGKSCHVLGKLDTCDLKLEHPSISRYHLIFQWHKVDRTWKMMDYGSTHGVKVNKMKLKPHQYTRCTVGSVLEIGLSTRKYVLNGPVEDQLKESEESGFELREKFKKRQKKLEKQMMGESDSDSDEDKPKKEDGVSWGFTEDAWDEDNDFDDIDSSKKPNFLKDALDPNAFYNRDPLKAINHFFTSDNQEPPWILNQTPKGRWECKLELPIGDGASGVIVSSEGDGKIGAKTMCALEACKALDRHGMFDEHAKARKKRNKLEENDFYDSDEDEFFDRTGELNQKREKRKKAAGIKHNHKEKAMTHDEILDKLKGLNDQLNELDKKMSNDKKMREITKNSDDPLDAFMKQVKSGKALDSITRSKMHREKAEILKEIGKFDRLAKLSAPANFSDQLQTDEDKKKKMQQNLLNRMKTGKRRFGVTGMTSSSVHQKAPKATSKLPDKSTNFVEHDSDEEKTDTPKTIKLFDKNATEVSKKSIAEQTKASNVTTKPEARKTERSPQKKSSKNESTQIASHVEPTTENSPKSKRVKMSATIIPGMIENNYKEEYSINPTEGNESEKKIRHQKKIDRQSKAKAMKNFDQTYQESAEYSTWVPPSNQTGDGTTDLNKKLGY